MSDLIKVELKYDSKQLLRQLSEFYAKQIMTDLTIDCSNGRLFAHKLILSSVSIYFRQLFTQNNNKSDNSLIIFGDILLEDIKTIVDCIYFGKQLVESNRLQNLLKIADRLGIDLSENQKKFENNVKKLKTNSKQGLDTNPIFVGIKKEEQSIGHRFDPIDRDLEIDKQNDIKIIEPLDLSHISGEKRLGSVLSRSLSEERKRRRKQSEPKQCKSVKLMDPLLGIQMFDSSQESIPESLIVTNGPIDKTLELIASTSTDLIPSKASLYSKHNNDNALKTVSQMNELEKTIDFVAKSSIVCSDKYETKQEMKDCLICKKTFSSEKRVLSHMKKMHCTQDKGFQCFRCKEEFKFPKKFVTHLNVCVE